MNQEKIKKEIISPNLKSDEKLIGIFQAQCVPSALWYLLLGPLFYVGSRVYYVAVTNNGIHFHKLNIFGKPDTYNYFPWNEIEKLKLGEVSMWQLPLDFKFSNGRKLELKAQVGGIGNPIILDEKTKEFILSKTSQE